MSHTRNTNDFLNIENSNRFVKQGSSSKLKEGPRSKPKVPSSKRKVPSSKPKLQAQKFFESESNQ